MDAPVVFYYDFNSPYAYLAAERIGDLIPDAEWRPIAFAILLGRRSDAVRKRRRRRRRALERITLWSHVGDRCVTSSWAPAASICCMNLLQAGLGPVRRLLHAGSPTSCFVCHSPILPSEERLRVRGDTVVHRRCATYRMRTRRSDGSRVGFPG